jgi:hypothetical protein
MLFSMLVGNPPFEKAHRDDVRYAMIADGRLREMLDLLKLSHRMTDAAVDIIECMVCEPQHRLALDELWNHDWLRQPLSAGNVAPHIIAAKAMPSNSTTRGSVQNGERGAARASGSQSLKPSRPSRSAGPH